MESISQPFGLALDRAIAWVDASVNGRPFQSKRECGSWFSGFESRAPAGKKCDHVCFVSFHFCALVSLSAVFSLLSGLRSRVRHSVGPRRARGVGLQPARDARADAQLGNGVR